MTIQYSPLFKRAQKRLSNLILGITITAFLCAFHFYLASLYYHFVYPSIAESSSLLNYSQWSFSFRQEFYFVNFLVLFVGVAMSILAAVVKSD